LKSFYFPAMVSQQQLVRHSNLFAFFNKSIFTILINHVVITHQMTGFTFYFF
jgi:hypothetical protein